MQENILILDGNRLTIHDLLWFIKNSTRKVCVHDDAYERVRKAKFFLDAEIKSRKILYGINTGFGPMASHIIPDKQLAELQVNLIRSHATGMGKRIGDAYVLAAMVIRLNTLAKGYSGVSPALIQQLEIFINHRIIPVVRTHGAVGTSGDLVQLAQIALALIGEGEVRYRGACRNTSDVLKELEITPHILQLKEGLALINGTSAMTAVAAFVASDAERLISIGVRLGALALEIVGAYEDSVSERLHRTRPHKGQIMIADTLRAIVSFSPLLKDRSRLKKNKHGETVAAVEKIAEEVQQVYSIRCIPQILGPMLDILCKVKADIETEMNAVTDNPIIDWEQKQILHGGNFHGDYIAVAMDQLKAAMVKLTMLAERRTNFFLHEGINKRFPPFLNRKTPGLTLGLQGLQFVATSTTAHSQSLVFPHAVHSIPTNGDNQDVVSMGFDAAMLAADVVANAYIVLAIELVTLCQAVDCLGIHTQLSKESNMLFSAVRKISPTLIEDRVLMNELDRITAFLKDDIQLPVIWPLA